VIAGCNASEFVGQDSVVARLGRWLALDHTPTSVLFSGPPMVGKTTLALIYTRALMCMNRPKGALLECCGECFPCKALLAGPFSDFTFVLPRTKQITVQIVSEEYDDFSVALRHPVHSRKRVIMIDNAHTLNEQTGNMMLKLFEEAPDATVFILVTDHPYDVLPTIRSRCEEIRLCEEPALFLSEKLIESGTDPDCAKRASRFAQGKWVLARILADDKKLLEGVESLTSAFFEILGDYGDKAGFVSVFVEVSNTLSEHLEKREKEVIAWTLPDAKALGLKKKKELERWEVSQTRLNEIARSAQKTTLDWLREALVHEGCNTPVSEASAFARSNILEITALIDRAETWLMQNVNEDYLFYALASSLGRMR